MRKLFWGLTAVAVTAAGGMLWLKWQGPTLPFTFAGTAAIECCRPGPDGGSGTTVSSVPGSSRPVPDNGDDDLSTFQKPADPVEIGEITLPGSDQGLAGAIDFTPAPVVPAITIPEPLEIAKPVAVAGSGGLNGDLTIIPTEPKVDPALLQANAVAIGTAHGAVPTAPRVMPYAQADEPPPKMDDPTDDPDDDEPGDDEPPSVWSWLFPPVKQAVGHPAGAPAPSDCREDEHYHEQYPGCPYTGFPYPGHCTNPPPYVEPKTPALPTVGPDGTEGGDVSPMMKRKTSQKILRQRLRRLGDDGPMVPEVDTMEFRPSDHSAYEHLPNPI